MYDSGAIVSSAVSNVLARPSQDRALFEALVQHVCMSQAATVATAARHQPVALTMLMVLHRAS